MPPDCPYRLGCPVFGARSWVGEVLPAGTRNADQLREYARLFSAVEGNSTFYGLPSAATVLRWAETAPEAFRFVFKLPRTVTHERALRGVREEVRRFLGVLAPLGSRLGPFMIQLPPEAGFGALASLGHFIESFPSPYRWRWRFGTRNGSMMAERSGTFTAS